MPNTPPTVRKKLVIAVMTAILEGERDHVSKWVCGRNQLVDSKCEAYSFEATELCAHSRTVCMHNPQPTPITRRYPISSPRLESTFNKLSKPPPTHWRASPIQTNSRTRPVYVAIKPEPIEHITTARMRGSISRPLVVALSPLATWKNIGV